MRRVVQPACTLRRERRRRRPRTRIWLAGVLASAAVALLIIARRATGPRVGDPRWQRSQRVSLEPVEIAGPWWRRHRYWLLTPAPFAGTRAVVTNARTGAVYDWRFRGNRRGHGWFGVRTRWAWVHPAWKDDPWGLLYDHADGWPSPRPAASPPEDQALL